MTIWAFNDPTDNSMENDERDQIRKLVAESVRSGKSRFGWSQEDEDNLSLRNEWSPEREKYGRPQLFLLDINKNDWIVHINVPEWGRCTAAQVLCSYDFDDGLKGNWGRDYKHFIGVKKDTVIEFDRNDSIVRPELSTRLKLPGRRWTIYGEEAFQKLLESLRKGTEPTPRTPETNLQYLAEDIRPLLSEIAQKIQSTHPNFDLEALVEKIFKGVPGVSNVERKRGRADQGADLLVELEFGSTPGLVQTIVVQVKSYVGEHDETSAVEGIRKALEYYENASMGLIVSTATSCSENLMRALDRLREESGKPIALLYGANLAAFFLRFGGHLLR